LTSIVTLCERRRTQQAVAMDTEDYIQWNKGLDTSWDNVGPRVVLAAAIAPVFSVIFVALRFYTARAILRTFHKDDCKFAWFSAVIINLSRDIDNLLTSTLFAGLILVGLVRLGRQNHDRIDMRLIENIIAIQHWILHYTSNTYVQSNRLFDKHPPLAAYIDTLANQKLAMA